MQQSQFGHAAVHTPKSAMAITALVVGLVALLTSMLPILNNGSFFLALLGIVFGLVGLMSTLRAQRSGKALASAALVVNVVAIVLVLASQSAYSEAIDEAFEGPAAVGTSTAGTTPAQPDASPAPQDTGSSVHGLPMGTAVDLANGLSVSVDSVQVGLVNYDGSTSTAVNVTYANNGDANVSFNMFDWKGQSPQGVQASATVYLGDTPAPASLGSGDLVPGGSVSGAVFFDGDVESVLYNASIFSSEPTASWTVA